MMSFNKLLKIRNDFVKLMLLKEQGSLEKRVALTPDGVKRLCAKGFDVYVEKSAGKRAYFLDEHYVQAGAQCVEKSPDDVDVYVKVTPPSTQEVDALAKDASSSVFIALLNPYQNQKVLEAFNAKKITALALDLVPRISRAQTMDVLSSQANLAGYRSVIDSGYHYEGLFPMMMTAAGTVKPAKVLVLGAGVAGLQAIATAKRLGAIVSAYDVRPVVKEQVESLGARFVDIKQDENDLQNTTSAYAKEMSDSFKKRQEEALKEAVKSHDIVITTAQIPGKKAPLLITKDMIHSMKAGSVIFDMAVESGGNCEGSKADDITLIHGVKIVAPSHFASTMAPEASRLFSRNLLAFIDNLYDEEKNIRFEDDIVKGAMVCKDGLIVHDSLLKKSEVA
jgi:NAD(P) transhydrogenase subunit alpha